MNRERIRQHIMNFSKELDGKTLSDFQNRMNCRLVAQRQKGRTGWELMTEVELADLMCKVMNRAQEKGENFYIDLANLLMFCHALEVDPQDIMVVWEEHLGRNWQCRQQELDKYDTPHDEIEAAGIKPTIVDAVAGIPDGADCEIYLVGNLAPKRGLWSVQEQEFIVPCDGGGAVGYSPKDVLSYHIVSEPKTEPDVLPIEAMPKDEVISFEPDPLESGGIYTLKVDGAACFNYFKYREASNTFKECSTDGRLHKGGQQYAVDDFRIHLEWERVKEDD